jgi:hypothetical protein
MYRTLMGVDISFSIHRTLREISMKASVLIGTLGLTGLAIGLGQWSAAVVGSDAASLDRTSARTTVPATKSENHVDPSTHSEGDSAERETQSATFGPGANIEYSGIYQVMNHGAVADFYAYSLGSQTCNLGDQSLSWINNGTPGFASNAYRIHNGRMLQIGTGWVKHACCVANQNNPSVCSGLTCSGSGFGLRPGCLDVYSASWNSNQPRLGPRVNINPYTGQFATLPGGGNIDNINRRLQIERDDMMLTNYPGALYFVEGVYVCTSSSQAGNMLNNASHRRVTFNQTSFAMSLAPEEDSGIPAIFAWQNHGNGVNTPDPLVKVLAVDLPGEGRLYVGYRAADNGDGTWRYDYAIYNLNSHQAAGSFNVEIGSGVNITNVGFHSPRYHSGENQDMTPWPHTIVNGDSISWTTAHSYAQNPNANAVRWGTMHNFWFDADQPPVMRNADIGVFVPGAASGGSVVVFGPADGQQPCIGDINDDGIVDGGDLLILLSEWGNCQGCDSDLNDDNVVDGGDLLILLANWGECP